MGLVRIHGTVKDIYAYALVWANRSRTVTACTVDGNPNRSKLRLSVEECRPSRLKTTSATGCTADLLAAKGLA